MRSSDHPARATTRLHSVLVHGVLLVVLALAVAQGYELLASSPSTAAPPDRAARGEHRREPAGARAAVANLDPALRGALSRAAAAAAAAGIRLSVNSGWRSPDHQERLFRQAVLQHGSEAEAARWVATAETSPHVSGDAVDLGPSQAAAWLANHGAAYGLCRVYANEPWHFELRPEAVDRGCPPVYADPTHDPRMQR